MPSKKIAQKLTLEHSPLPHKAWMGKEKLGLKKLLSYPLPPSSNRDKLLFSRSEFIDTLWSLSSLQAEKLKSNKIKSWRMMVKVVMIWFEGIPYTQFGKIDMIFYRSLFKNHFPFFQFVNMKRNINLLWNCLIAFLQTSKFCNNIFISKLVLGKHWKFPNISE